MSQLKTGALAITVVTLFATMAWTPRSSGFAGKTATSGSTATPQGESIDTAMPLLARQVDLDARTDLFSAVHPGARASTWKGYSTVYGPAFGNGASATEAAEQFRKESLPLFGIDPADLKPGQDFLPQGTNTVGLMWQPESQSFKFTAVYYSQQRDGVAVFEAGLIVLTRNEPGHPVVLAESSLRDLGAFRVAAGAAINAGIGHTKARKSLGAQAQFTAGRTVVWGGVGESVVAPALAVEFIGTSIDGAGMPVERRFITDAATGAILYEEDLIVNADITGNVSGMASTGAAAAVCVPEAVTSLPYAYVTVNGTDYASDINGNFSIPDPGGPVTVTSRLAGPRFFVNTTLGTNSVLNQANVNPGAVVNFVHNSANVGEYDVAQVNTYLECNRQRNLVLQYNPSFPAISTEVNFPINANINQTCNAFYSPGNQSINFYVAGGGCNNTGFSNVLHHEYGHRMVNAAGSGQGAFGEGYGDCMSVVMSDSPCLGDGFQACGTCLRNANNTCQYQTTGCSSCGSEIHACGQLISGCVWSTRNNLAATNPGTYQQILHNLVVDSVLVHGSGTTITPAITVQWLTLDDNDANIGNGTPHYAEINNGFTAHNMAGPPLSLLAYSFPNGQPAFVSPAGTSTVLTNVSAISDTPVPGTGVIFVDTGSGFQQYSMTESPINSYEATIPASTCGTVVKYYFRAQALGGGFQFSPGNAPTSFYTATSGYGVDVLFSDNFQSDQGWSASNSPIAGGTYAGDWERGVPVTPPATGAPGADADGSGQCFVTRNNNTNPDVDFGFAILTSPIMDASGSNVSLNFTRWFHRTSSTASGDVFRVETSNNGGTNWTTLELVGSATGTITGSWVARSFPIVGGTNQFRVRFTVNDNSTNSTSVEGGVDGLSLQRLICTPPPTPCPADVNGNNIVDIDDLVFVISNFGATSGPADINQDNIVNIDDLVLVITGWGNCP